MIKTCTECGAKGTGFNQIYFEKCKHPRGCFGPGSENRPIKELEDNYLSNLIQDDCIVIVGNVDPSECGCQKKFPDAKTVTSSTEIMCPHGAVWSPGRRRDYSGDYGDVRWLYTLADENYLKAYKENQK